MNKDNDAIKSLWQSVAMQAILDALKTKNSKERFLARKYIIHDKDFYLVSQMANLDPDKLRNSLISKLKAKRNNK